MTVIETIELSGWLRLAYYGEADDILFLSDEPLVDLLQESVAGRQVSIRYWICDQEETKSSAIEAFLHKLDGIAEANFGANYSEVTGYLWTDEELVVGGHDLVQEFYGSVGKFLILEVDIHP